MDQKKKYKIMEPTLDSKMKIYQDPSWVCIEEEIYENCGYENHDLENIDFEKTYFKNVLFKNMNFVHVNFHKAQFTNTLFTDCDLSNIDFSQCNFDRCKFVRCKIMGGNFSESVHKDVIFAESNGQYSNFRFSSFNHTLFDHCLIQSGDFLNSEVKALYFDSCHLNQAMFYNVSLSGVDLRNSDFQTLGVNLEDLKGLIISPDQGLSFLNLLGLDILND